MKSVSYNYTMNSWEDEKREVFFNQQYIHPIVHHHRALYCVIMRGLSILDISTLVCSFFSASFQYKQLFFQKKKRKIYEET